MLEANPSLSPNLVKAILQYTAEFNAGFHALEQGAGFVDAKGAVTLAKYLKSGAPDSAYPSEPSWSKTVIWGNLRVSGGVIAPNANSWGFDVLWGSSVTPRGGHVLWGDNCANTTCTGATRGTNSIWKNGRGATLRSATRAFGAYWEDNIVWGNYSDDNIVWGNAGDDNIVWGNYNDDNIVWGNAGDDNIVWGNYNDDNIVWGNYADDNIVWGNYADDNIVWGN